MTCCQAAGTPGPTSALGNLQLQQSQSRTAGHGGGGGSVGGGAGFSEQEPPPQQPWEGEEQRASPVELLLRLDAGAQIPTSPKPYTLSPKP